MVTEKTSNCDSFLSLWRNISYQTLKLMDKSTLSSEELTCCNIVLSLLKNGGGLGNEN